MCEITSRYTILTLPNPTNHKQLYIYRVGKQLITRSCLCTNMSKLKVQVNNNTCALYKIQHQLTCCIYSCLIVWDALSYCCMLNFNTASHNLLESLLPAIQRIASYRTRPILQLTTRLHVATQVCLNSLQVSLNQLQDNFACGLWG